MSSSQFSCPTKVCLTPNIVPIEGTISRCIHGHYHTPGEPAWYCRLCHAPGEPPLTKNVVLPYHGRDLRDVDDRKPLANGKYRDGSCPSCGSCIHAEDEDDPRVWVCSECAARFPASKYAASKLKLAEIMEVA